MVRHRRYVLIRKTRSRIWFAYMLSFLHTVIRNTAQMMTACVIGTRQWCRLTSVIATVVILFSATLRLTLLFVIELLV
ncbi:hypothetical protein V1515DRAFT_612468 [Lipomyces mesembrius]